MAEAAKRGIARFKRFWSYVFLVAPLAPLEALSAVFLTWSSVKVLNPSVNTYSTAAFKYISWLPEEIFGALMLFVGLNALIAVISGNLRYRSYTTFATFIFISAFYAVLRAGNPDGVIIPWVGIMSLVSFVVWLRVRESSRQKETVVWM